MSFNDGAQLDTSQVGSGGGGLGGRMIPGGVGGVGGVILLVLYLVFGGDLGAGGGAGGRAGGGQPGSQGMSVDEVGAAGTGSEAVSQQISQCRTGADANRDDTCRVIGTVNSVQDFWNGYLPRHGTQYRQARTILYQGATQTECGTGSSQMGPFYCPLDERVYIDVSFFNDLSSSYGADGGNLAQMYVVAHEYGHHVQQLTGVLGRAQQDPQGPQSGAVRTELQADCYAGVWVNHASTTKDAQGRTLLRPVTEQDIRSALSAASAVGDDRIQQKSQGRVTPESWTHGSSAQRQKWFMAGYRSGEMNTCDTFNTPDLG